MEIKTTKHIQDMFWKYLECDLNVIDARDGNKVSFEQQVLRALVSINYRLKLLEKSADSKEKNGG